MLFPLFRQLDCDEEETIDAERTIWWAYFSDGDNSAFFDI